MLQVAEIDKAFGGFLFPKAVSEQDHSFRQLLHQRSRLVQLCEEGFGRTAEQGIPQIGDRILDLVAKSLDRLLKSGIGGILLARLQLAEGGVLEQTVQPGPRPFIDRLQQLFDERQIGLHIVGVRRRPSGLQRNLQPPLELADGSGQRQSRLFQNAAYPFRSGQTVRIRRGEGFRRPSQPFLRPWMAPREIMQTLNERIHGVVTALPAEPIRQLDEYPVLPGLFIFFLEQLFQQLLAHHFRFMLIQDTEARVQRNLLVIAADDVQTEGVQRRDGSSAEQRQLALQMSVVRIALQLLVQRFPYPLPHFGRSRLGERSHQKTIDAEAAVLVPDFADNALDEHGRFTRTGGCRNENIVPALGDRPPLVVAPDAAFRLDRHDDAHCSCPPSFPRESISHTVSLPGLPSSL
ncbi:hypothetical protein D3C75_148740 [compost metagenome]